MRFQTPILCVLATVTGLTAAAPVPTDPVPTDLPSATAAAAAALGSVTLFVGTGVAQAFASSGETKLEVKLGLDGLRLQIAE